MSRIDCDGNQEQGILELLSCVAANTAIPGIAPRSILRTSTAAVDRVAIVKAQPGTFVAVFDIWSYASAATTISFVDDRGNVVMPSIYHSAQSSIGIASYRELSLKEGRSLLYSTSGNTVHILCNVSVIESTEHSRCCSL
jgi:hypothetical protein